MQNSQQEKQHAIKGANALPPQDIDKHGIFWRFDISQGKHRNIYGAFTGYFGGNFSKNISISGRFFIFKKIAYFCPVFSAEYEFYHHFDFFLLLKNTYFFAQNRNQNLKMVFFAILVVIQDYKIMIFAQPLNNERNRKGTDLKPGKKQIGKKRTRVLKLLA